MLEIKKERFVLKYQTLVDYLILYNYNQLYKISAIFL